MARLYLDYTLMVDRYFDFLLHLLDNLARWPGQVLLLNYLDDAVHIVGHAHLHHFDLLRLNRHRFVDLDRPVGEGRGERGRVSVDSGEGKEAR